MEGKTKVGRLLQKLGNIGKPILQILSKVPIPGADLLGEVADKIRTSGEIDQEMKNDLLHAISQDMQDLANAREHNREIQKSQFSSWMAKNVPYLIDIMVMLTWCIGFFYISGRMTNMIEGQADLTPLVALFSGVTALATQILGFHRGSTAGSRLKDIFKDKG